MLQLTKTREFNYRSGVIDTQVIINIDATCLINVIITEVIDSHAMVPLKTRHNAWVMSSRFMSEGPNVDSPKTKMFVNTWKYFTICAIIAVMSVIFIYERQFSIERKLSWPSIK